MPRLSEWVIGAAAIASAVSAATLAHAQRAPQIVRSQLTWVDRAGRKLATVSDLADFGDIELSPDRTQIAAAVLNDQTGRRELWQYDATTGRKSKLTTYSGGLVDENWLIWSPDGARIVYNSQRTGGLDLYARDVGSTRETRLAVDKARGQWPVSWSPDGANLLVVTNAVDTGNDVWVLPLTSSAGGQPTPYPLLNTSAQENWAAFSPNGRWVAFSDKDAGEDTQLYVTTFPKSNRRWLVSAQGGFQARWRRDGRELFFLATNGTLTTSLMVAEVNPDGADFEITDVRKLFDTAIPYPPYHAFDVSADGQRILINSLLLGPSAPRSARVRPMVVSAFRRTSG